MQELQPSRTHVQSVRSIALRNPDAFEPLLLPVHHLERAEEHVHKKHAPAALQGESKHLEDALSDLTSTLRLYAAGKYYDKLGLIELLWSKLPIMDSWLARLEAWMPQVDVLEPERIKEEVKKARRSTRALVHIVASTPISSIRDNAGFLFSVEPIENAEKEVSNMVGRMRVRQHEE